MKQVRQKCLAIAVAGLAHGCMTVPSVPVGTAPVCHEEKQCAEMWDAAQLFVVHYAGMKLQTVTNVVIETFNSPDYKTDLAMRVTKEPIGGGAYRLTAEAWCGNFLGCMPNASVVVAAFNTQLKEIGNAP